MLCDNIPLANYFYLVTILTGWKKGGGTTSLPGIILQGSKAKSLRHVLYHPDREFDAGSEHTFLLATLQDLGTLKSVQVWISCTGPYPSW